MRRTVGLALLSVGALFMLAARPAVATNIAAEGSARPAFREIWAYLLRGEERELTGVEPVTDIGYFGAGLATDGRIADSLTRPSIVMKDGSRPRVHLVVAELANSALMHFSLDPQYGVRPLLIGDICRLAQGFDGVQVDFEAVARDDADHFFDFLKELKARLPGKTLSVAVPARTEPMADAYDYSRIAPIVDRMIVMAYDEHWSSSAPGPVASLPWCARVVGYAAGAIAQDKLVIGLPLYGRAWPDKRLARALRFRNVQDLVSEKNATTSYSSEQGASFEYSENVVVKVFYDNVRSLMEKLWLCRARNIDSVSFWRIGQGPPELWNGLEIARAAETRALTGSLAESPAPGDGTHPPE